MKILWEDMSWPEIEEVLKRPNAVILPTGSTEQHGLHLPVNVDSRCAAYIAEQAARKVSEENQIPVLVLPVVPYGDTATFRYYPGTVSLSIDTFSRVVEDIVRSLVVDQGVKNVVVLNGHNSNTIAIATALRKLSTELPGTGLYAVTWWDLGFDVIPGVRKSELDSHAGELETSLSLVIQPENVHLEKAVKETPTFSLSSRWVLPDLQRSPDKVFYHSRKKYPKGTGQGSGVMGDPTVASRETGGEIVSAVVDDLAQIILEIVRSEKGHAEKGRQ